MNQALKNNPLLAQLKATLVEEKRRVIGEVLPSRKTFGFLLDEQGNRHFLAPPMMEKLLPGDRVEAVIEAQDERESAVVEKVISTSLTELYGVVRIRNGAVFIQPESDLLSSWMKLANVKDLDEGDWVKATLIEHPFAKGKAKAKVIALIAKGGDKSMPWNLAIDRYGILPEPVWTPTEILAGDGYVDLTSLAFVTIDGESTMDVDDALYAEKVDNGFKLWIAIADPSSCVMPGSMLDETAMARGVTTYLPGETHPMLPRELSEKAVSLLENVDRPALVCEVFVDLAGDVSNVTFKMANIRSKAKLSYNLVNDYLSGHCNLNRPEEVSRTVAVLAECAQLLRTVRKQDAVLGDFGDDIRFLVQGHDLNGFKREARHEAHFLVEECMIVGNRAFAAYAHAHQLPCIYRSQKGYAPEDYAKVTEILQHWGLVEEAPDLSDLATFVRIAQLLTLPEYFVPNVLLRGYMEKGQYSLAPNPHMGLGLSLYATFTSPIRKYSDLINHRIMKAHLRGEPLPVLEESAVSRIDSQNVLANKAAREVQKRLFARHYHWNNGEAEEGRIIQIRKDSIRVESLATSAYVSIPMKELVGDEQAIQLSAFDSELWIDGVIQYRIGDVIRFGVNKVNPITANLDGVLAPPQVAVA
jgi:exoribonuclease II